MIIEIPEENSIIKWKYDDRDTNEKWKFAEVSDLIKAFEGWDELKETIKELSENEGVLTQQEVCKFLINLMGVIEGTEMRVKGGQK